MKTWVGLEYDGRIIGSCYGRIWGNEMSIEELALLPEFYGNGLWKIFWQFVVCTSLEHFGEPVNTFLLVQIVHINEL
ncbi:hypothetical protein F7734_58750 [Scytonema sp. UIC 10036]|nr:hypothetical protein [Scytonema sp. UIC 10036]MUH01587.1 hypothetical protein [Scytonema sp. UIC 10036]